MEWPGSEQYSESGNIDRPCWYVCHDQITQVVIAGMSTDVHVILIFLAPAHGFMFPHA